MASLSTPSGDPAAKPLRTAILGYGVAGRFFHGTFLGSNPAYEVAVISTADPDRAVQAREDHPGALVIADPRTVVDHAGDLDLVVVCTPPSSHVELARVAMRAGLDVVVDKPFAPSSKEGTELIAEASQAGRRLSVFQNRRYDADFLTLRSLLEEGTLGAVHTFESRFEWWKPTGERSWKASTPVKDGGGILFDLGPHLIDQALQLFGPVSELQAHVRSVGNELGPDNTAHLCLTHANGTISRLIMSSLSALEGPRFHVSGTEGAWRTYGKAPQEAALRSGAGPGTPGFGQESEAERGELSIDGQFDPTPAGTGDYGRYYRELADALNTGAPVPVEPQDAVDALRLIEAAHRAPHTNLR